MKLMSLLEQHRKFSNESGARVDSLGDGFLLRHNRIYRNIRASAMKNGFQFSTKQNDAYRALPLSQLDLILKSKVIPYIDNVTVLSEIETKIPRQTVWNDISDNLKGNSIFHESCHGVARGFASKLDQSLAQEAGLSEVRAKVLAVLLEESFANMCELLSILDAEDQVHRIFLELNSYIYMLGDRVHMANAQRDVGTDSLALFLLLCYLHANFLKDITDREFDRLLCLAGINSNTPAKKNLRQLTKIAFQLNPRFREVTTRFYLQLNRLPYPEIFGWDFLKAIENSTTALDFLRQAAASVSA